MTPDQAKDFLALIPTAVLYEEFKTRFDHCILAGLSRRPLEDDHDHYLLSYTYSGAPLFCVGLASLVSSKCHKDIDGQMDVRAVDEL